MSRLRLCSRRNPGVLIAAGAMAVLMAASVTVPAEAREGGKGRHFDRAAMFERADADGDGKVTMEELSALRGERFSRIDANGDGQLSQEELTAMGREKAERRAARMLERMDENGDGVISEAEFAALSEDRADRMFARADANGDGAIDRDEMENMKFKRGRHSYGRHGERPER